jgi:small multidrug resistance family-3 protein
MLFVLAALCEIAGCFAFWAWARRGAASYWPVVGTAVLVLFALLLANVPTGFAGRAFAAYGGIYIAASVVWMWAVEGQRPTPGDVIGATLAVVGAVVIVSLGRRR